MLKLIDRIGVVLMILGLAALVIYSEVLVEKEVPMTELLIEGVPGR